MSNRLGHGSSSGENKDRNVSWQKRSIAIAVASAFALSSIFLLTGSTQKTYAANPAVTLNADFTTCCLGNIEFTAQVQNASAPFDSLRIQGLAPDNTVVYDKTFPVGQDTATAQDGFLIQRQFVDGSYQVVASYQGQTVSKVIAPYSSFEAQPPTFVALLASSSQVSGRIQGGIEGEPVSASIYSPSNALLTTLTGTTSLHNQFSFDLTTVQPMFTESGTYRVVLTHVPTGITGETTFSYTNPNAPATTPSTPSTPPSNSSTPGTPASSGSATTPAGSSGSSTTVASSAGTSTGTTIASTSGENNTLANGTIASMLFTRNNTAHNAQNITGATPFLAAGNWTLHSINGNVTLLSANFTIVRTDGTDRHIYQLSDFSQNATQLLEPPKNGTSTISGKASIVLDHGTPTPVNATLSISRLNAINITLHSEQNGISEILQNQPIYGVTNSLVQNGQQFIEQPNPVK